MLSIMTMIIVIRIAVILIALFRGPTIYHTCVRQLYRPEGALPHQRAGGLTPGICTDIYIVTVMPLSMGWGKPLG